MNQHLGDILEYFEAAMPNPKSELNYRNNFELLVAVVLSAQCTDKRVNMVTPALFAAYPTPHAMAQASESQIMRFIYSVTYPESKSRYLVELSKMLVENFGGEVPQSVDDLQTLPGVGRKTANVVTAVAFGIPAMPVDTHVNRVAYRLGLTKANSTPLATEKALIKLIPADKLINAHHWLILHGRYTCTALSPRCGNCGISQWCDYKKKITR